MARWDGPPFAGEVWRRKTSNPDSQRTRHVMDRTYGGDVIFVQGRWSRYAQKSQCSLGEWMDWAEDANLIRTDDMGQT